MHYAFIFYRKQILTSALIAALFSWAVIVTIQLMRTKPTLTLIAISDNKAHIISETIDRASEIETENFIRRFVGLGFNYNNETYEENVSLATDLMSDAVFEQVREELAKVRDTIKGKPVEQSAVVSSIKRLEPSRYEIILKTDQMINKQNSSFDTRVRVRLSPSERTTRNPWGIEITEFTYDRP